jgi:hypothetical protein
MRGFDGQIASPGARFLQVRLNLGANAAAARVQSLSLAYLQRNLRPRVMTMTVHPPGEVFQKTMGMSGEPEILGAVPGETASADPARPEVAQQPANFGRKMYQRGMQTISWKAEDPNNDALTFDVSFRLESGRAFTSLRKGINEAVVAWDTSTVPNGRYVVKVVASDAGANPAAAALTGERESSPFDIDNTPPEVTLSIPSRNPLRIRALARDADSAIRKFEYAVDGGRWQDLSPVDGVSDSREETYEIALTDSTPHVVAARATDQLGNAGTSRLEIAGGS